MFLQCTKLKNIIQILVCFVFMVNGFKKHCKTFMFVGLSPFEQVFCMRTNCTTTNTTNDLTVIWTHQTKEHCKHIGWFGFCGQWIHETPYKHVCVCAFVWFLANLRTTLAIDGGPEKTNSQ